MTTEKLEDIKGLSDLNHKTDNTMTTEKLEDIIGLSDVNHRTDNKMTTEKLEDIKGLSDVNHIYLTWVKEIHECDPDLN
jgi:hypothetical protein